MICPGCHPRPDGPPELHLEVVSEQLQVVHVQPHDVIVAQTDALLSPSYRGMLHYALRHFFPGAKICILDGGLKIAILRQ